MLLRKRWLITNVLGLSLMIPAVTVAQPKASKSNSRAQVNNQNTKQPASPGLANAGSGSSQKKMNDNVRQKGSNKTAGNNKQVQSTNGISYVEAISSYSSSDGSENGKKSGNATKTKTIDPDGQSTPKTNSKK